MSYHSLAPRGYCWLIVELGPKSWTHKLRCINGASHQACGGAERWSRNGDDTRQPTSFGLRWRRLKAAKRPASVSTTARRLKSTSCYDQSRPHPSGCTLFYPFRGPNIGTRHTVLSSIPIPAGSCCCALISTSPPQERTKPTTARYPHKSPISRVYTSTASCNCSTAIHSPTVWAWSMLPGPSTRASIYL